MFLYWNYKLFSEFILPPWPEVRLINIVGESDFESRQKREIFRSNNINGRKNADVKEDVTNPKYRAKAAEALNKFSRKNGILHKIVEVNHVSTRVVSGIIYEIDFTASPTNCLYNVTEVQARSCTPLKNATLYCHAQLWDQPWLRKKKIDVECYSSDDDDDFKEEEEEGEPDSSNATELAPKVENTREYALAERALDEFLSSTNRKYVFRIIEIQRSQDVVEGIITALEFSTAPTVCVREGFSGKSSSCEFKEPREQYNCKARIKQQTWLDGQKDISIHCKKQTNTSETGKTSILLSIL